MLFALLSPENHIFNQNVDSPLTGACKIVPLGISSRRNADFVAIFRLLIIYFLLLTQRLVVLEDITKHFLKEIIQF